MKIPGTKQIARWGRKVDPPYRKLRRSRQKGHSRKAQPLGRPRDGLPGARLSAAHVTPRGPGSCMHSQITPHRHQRPNRASRWMGRGGRLTLCGSELFQKRRERWKGAKVFTGKPQLIAQIQNCPVVFSRASVKRAPMNDSLNASASATVPLR